MLGALCRLVDGRTECKTAGGAAWTPIKDVMGHPNSGTAAAASGGADGLPSWRFSDRQEGVPSRERDDRSLGLDVVDGDLVGRGLDGRGAQTVSEALYGPRGVGPRSRPARGQPAIRLQRNRCNPGGAPAPTSLRGRGLLRLGDLPLTAVLAR